MNEDKKRWVPVCFPMGTFKGSVNIAIKGSNVLTAEEAKKLIDTTEGQLDANALRITKVSNIRVHGAGSPSSEGTPEV